MATYKVNPTPVTINMRLIHRLSVTRIINVPFRQKRIF